jgi:hypothetical protein
MKGVKKPQGRKPGGKVLGPTNAEIAKLLGCASSSVSRWRGEGLPVHDIEALKKELEARRNRRDAVMGVARGGEQYEPGETLPDTTRLGPGAALERLSQDEAARHVAYQRAVADKADANVVKRLHRQWLEVGNALRQYNLQIEQIRKDSGELIPRAHAEDAIAASAEALRLACMALAEGGVEDIVRAGMTGDYAAAGAVLIRRMTEQVPLAFRRMGQTRMGCPDWCLAAARKGLLRAEGGA